MCLTLLTNISTEANGVSDYSTLFVIDASLTFQYTRKQTTFVVIGALRVNSTLVDTSNSNKKCELNLNC